MLDRQSIIGFVLISLVVFAYMMYTTTTTQQVPNQKPQQAATQSKQSTAAAPAQNQSVQVSSAPFVAEKVQRIETDLYIAEISSKGFSFRSFQLKKFQPWYKKGLVNLVREQAREFNISFLGQDGKNVNTKRVDFEFITPAQNVTLQGKNTATIKGIWKTPNGATIERSYTFHGDSYMLESSVTTQNMDAVLPNTYRFYNIGWNNGLRYQERNSVDESGAASGFASLAGSLDELDTKEYNAPVSLNPTGNIDFIGTKSKYFIASIFHNTQNTKEAIIKGTKYGAPDNGVVEVYSAEYKVPYRGGVQTDNFSLYMGPLDYDIVKGYGMQSTVNFGWKWLVRPIGEFFMLPIFKFIHSYIPNFGIAIIVFSILLKILLTPLSRGQMESAKKMKALQPEIDKLRAKYADDQAALSQEQMKLFGQYGINPMGGCMPLLLQMPILYALYNVLTSFVEMRQASFIPGFIDDLSIPDYFIHLPYPVFGLTALSALAILMGLIMFFQQRMTITDPNQKAMIYMMPAMLTFMFSNLPSGLNLYYLTFNVLGVLQQVWQTKFSKNQLTLADLKKMPVKESWLQKKMREAQEIAEQQGRPLPGAPTQKSKRK